MKTATMRLRRNALRLGMACVLAACAPAPPAPPSPPASGPTALAGGEAFYAALRARGESVLRVDPQASLIAITVRRAGALARLGHDHLVASRAVDGFVAPGQNRADFHFRLDQLTVDDADLRADAGLGAQPSADAIAGTRSNMLGKVLDAEHFPDVYVRATRGAPDAPLSVAITLHGVRRTLTIPVRFETPPDGRRLAVSGTVEFRQSDFGLVPFAVLGGAIAVQDRLELRFRIVAVAP
ncbi:YceI family protein [Janthinobacterium sp.]|uniref:YceI family protein n=1 Tax=Janthinobacterium sp. TaxID=1871054 RepID=UPI00293D29CD|nr:YceI family protein [Janthinobacterium sp.]